METGTSQMKQTPIVSPDDQKVTFVELFFDLVFVFSITQVVSLLHKDLSWITVGQAILVFWLVWWGVDAPQSGKKCSTMPHLQGQFRHPRVLP